MLKKRGFEKNEQKVVWLELLPSSGDQSRDMKLIDIFQKRMTHFGLQDNFILLYVEAFKNWSKGCYAKDYEKIKFFGKNKEEFEMICRNTDALLNLWYSVRPPILNKFNFKILLDTDPGLLQICALSPNCDMGIGLHDKYFTVGENIGKEWCSIHTLGIDWIPFRQPVDLDVWVPQINFDCKRFTTLTQWEWESVSYEGRIIENSKRTQFMEYITLPTLTKQELELAANIHPSLKDDIDLLSRNDWHLVDPNKVAGDPLSYQKYVAQSRGEFSVAKGVYVQLKTGWFSDRSICYLASGKPVLVQDTGIGDNLPVGYGLLTFRNMSEATEAIDKINSDYLFHCRKAREIAEKYFNSNLILNRIMKEM